jgi:hypothetical protein
MSLLQLLSLLTHACDANDTYCNQLNSQPASRARALFLAQSSPVTATKTVFLQGKLNCHVTAR